MVSDEIVTKFMDELSSRMNTIIHEGITESQRLEHANKVAAWDLYVELMTRVVYSNSDIEAGKEHMMIARVQSFSHSAFEILKNHGKGCRPCAKLIFKLFDKVLRPFNEKHYKRDEKNSVVSPKERDAYFRFLVSRNEEFRKDFAELQEAVKPYIKQLAEIGGFNHE